MKKRVFKKILIIFFLATIFIIAISINNKSFAIGDVANDTIWQYWSPTVETDTGLLRKTGVILGVIQVVGVIISVATIAYIGIKFVIGSVEEKASYKQRILPWILGATMVFAITTIPSFIYNITQDSIGKVVEQDYGEANEVTGASDAAKWAQQKWDEIQIVVEDGKTGNEVDEQNRQNFITAIEKQRNDIRSSTPYLDAYKNFLKDVVTFASESPQNYVSAFCSIDTQIENGTINKKNINKNIEEVEEEIRTSPAIPAIRCNLMGKHDRLLLQERYWESKK